MSFKDYARNRASASENITEGKYMIPLSDLVAKMDTGENFVYWHRTAEDETVIKSVCKVDLIWRHYLLHKE